MVSEGRTKVMEQIQEEDKKAAIDKRAAEDKVFADMTRRRKQDEQSSRLNAGIAGKGNVRDRIMARTTFYDKSLHSDKHVNQLKAKEQRILAARGGAATNYERNDGKKKEK
jgi:hypothetical protein